MTCDLSEDVEVPGGESSHLRDSGRAALHPELPRLAPEPANYSSIIRCIKAWSALPVARYECYENMVCLQKQSQRCNLTRWCLHINLYFWKRLAKC